MGLFRRRRPAGTETKAQRREDLSEVIRHLTEFTRTRRGVEAFLEPATTVTPPTVLLIAATGEWTRRRVLDPAVIRELAEELHLPVYDVHLVGYPQRMRDWNARVRERGRQP